MEGSDRSTGIQVSTGGKGSRSFARVIRRVSVQRFSNRRGEKEEEEEEEKNSLTTGRAIDHSFHKENAFTRTCNHKLYNIRRCNKVDHPPAIHLFLFLPSLLSSSSFACPPSSSLWILLSSFMSKPRYSRKNSRRFVKKEPMLIYFRSMLYENNNVSFGKD